MIKWTNKSEDEKQSLDAINPVFNRWKPPKALICFAVESDYYCWEKTTTLLLIIIIVIFYVFLSYKNNKKKNLSSSEIHTVERQ